MTDKTAAAAEAGETTIEGTAVDVTEGSPQGSEDGIRDGEGISEAPDSQDSFKEFADLIDEDYGDVDEVEDKPAEKVPAESKPEETPKEEAQQEAPAPEEGKGTEQPAQPQEQPAPQQPEQPAEAQPPVSQEDIRTQYTEFFNKSVEALETVYQFDEETRELLDTEPSKVLPKLAANLHMQVLTAAVTQVANMMPAMLNLHQQSQSAAQSIEDKFYSAYPTLKEHRSTVDRVAMVYKQLNPNASQEQALQEIAAMAATQARVPLVPAEASQQPAVAPQRPVIPTSARSGAPAPSTGQPVSEWEELTQEE